MTAGLGRWIIVPAILAASCEEPASTPPASRSAARPSLLSQAPPHPFTDITTESGITFRHETGGFGIKYLPETMGAGGGFLDYDGDGRLDIFLVNSDYWPGREKGRRPLPASRRKHAHVDDSSIGNQRSAVESLPREPEVGPLTRRL